MRGNAVDAAAAAGSAAPSRATAPQAANSPSKKSPSSAPMVEVSRLLVRYGGTPFPTLEEISLSVPRGSVYALLGRNGAGKSSLVRCLLGQQKPTSGECLLFGEDVWKRRASLMARVGVVPEDPDAPPSMTARQLSAFCARLYPSWDAPSVETRLARFGVPAGTAYGSLSKGQRALVALALALASSPELLVLDDPTLGLDAVARRAFFEELVGELADRGTTVLLTSHDLAGVESMATHVGFLKDGRLALDEELETLKGRFRRLRYANEATEDRTESARSRGVRRRAREGARMGRRGRRLELRGGFVRQIHGSRGRRGRRVLGPVARGDLHRGRGRDVAREERMRAFAAVFRARGLRAPVRLPGRHCGGFRAAHRLPRLTAGGARSAAEGRVLVALVGATALSAAFAILLGGAVIVGETKEKAHLVLLLAADPGRCELWAGKLIAAVFVTFTTAFLAFFPGLALGQPATRDASGVRRDIPAGPLSRPSASPSSPSSEATRSSPWPGCVRRGSRWTSSSRRRSLPGRSAFTRSSGTPSSPISPTTSPPALAIPDRLPPLVGLALAAASYFQVAAGRTDARRAHGAFSVALWGILGTAVSVLGAFALWAASAKATDLAAVGGSVVLAPRGSGLLAGGGLRNLRGAGYFLFDAESLRSARVRSGAATFSQDGRRAAWGDASLGFLESGRTAEVKIADLPSVNVVGTGLDDRAIRQARPLGRRLQARDPRRNDPLGVRRDTPSPSAAARCVPDRGRVAPRRLRNENVIRLFPRFYNAARRDVSPSAREITELSLPSKKSAVTGRFDRETLPYLRLSADGQTLVGAKTIASRSTTDGRALSSRRLLSTPRSSAPVPHRRRIAVAGIAGARGMLVFFEGEEGRREPSRSVDLGPAKRVVLGGEIAPGRVAVALLPFEENLTTSHLASKLSLVDAVSGKVVFHADGLVPADQFGLVVLPRSPSRRGRCAVDVTVPRRRDRLVRLDPATGKRTVLLGKGK